MSLRCRQVDRCVFRLSLTKFDKCSWIIKISNGDFRSLRCLDCRINILVLVLVNIGVIVKDASKSVYPFERCVDCRKYRFDKDAALDRREES